MKPRPYKYYNISQVLGIIESNPENVSVALDMAYEIAHRRRISKEKRVQVISSLEEITVNSIATKNNQIRELKSKINELEQRIKELESTEKIISGSINTLKEQILQTILRELTDIKLTVSNSSTHQKNTINELKKIITLVDKEVTAIKATDDVKAGKMEVRFPEESDDLPSDNLPSEEMEDNIQDIRENTLPEISTESDNFGNEVKIGEGDDYNLPTSSGDYMPIKSKDTTGNERPAVEAPEIELGGKAVTLTEIKDLPISEKDNTIPDDQTTHYSHCLFEDLVARKWISVQNNRLILKENFSNEDHRILVFNLAFNVISKIDPKDVCLYYFYWWINNRDSEKITLIIIWDSLLKDIRSITDNNPVITMKPKIEDNSAEFFQLALKGMQEIGAKWSIHPDIKSLGSSPAEVFNDGEVKSKFSSYLSLLLKNAPETFEVFMLQMVIRDLLPDGIKTDIPGNKLHTIAKTIAISDRLTEPSNILPSFEIKLQEPSSGKRTYRPRNYWVLTILGNEVQISLELGLTEVYTPDDLSKILGFNVVEREYQFYLYEELICVFRKMINGNYNTEWHHDQKIRWNGESNLPKAYVTYKENKYEVSDFINSYPDLNEPSLWQKKSNTNWQLSKGNNISSKSGAILHPEIWQVSGEDSPDIYNVYGKNMYWSLFEGKVSIQTPSGEQRDFQSNVSSFNWIILDQSPKWMVKSDMVVVQNTLKIVVYTQDDEVNITNEAHIWINSRNNSDSWVEYSENMDIPVGILDIKIDKNGVLAYDSCFNIGRLRIEFQVISSTSAEINLYDNPFNKFSIVNTSTYNITQESNQINLELASYTEKIPETLQCRIGYENQRTLLFHIASPVSGLSIVDPAGHLVPTGQHLTYTTLEGYRILARKDKANIVSFKNTLRTDVVISKELKHESTPFISFKEEIHRLLYLADIMNFNNSVTLELSDGTEENTLTYTISEFTHTLNTDNESTNILKLEGPDHDLDLFAIPLNCAPHEISPLPMPGNDAGLFIPACDFTDKFIIISANQEGNQLMPRFVTLDLNYDPGNRQERIDAYHKSLADSFFSNRIWRETQAYFNICTKFDIPFSTFDQLSAIARSSKTAAIAFLFFAISQEDIHTYIQKTIPSLEEDLGICFHWVGKSDWSQAIKKVSSFCERRYGNSHWEYFVDVLKIYTDINSLAKMSTYLLSENPIEVDLIHHQDIMSLRGRLGKRVLEELPNNKPIIQGYYGIPFNGHQIVALLLHAPIAAAESIAGIQHETPIWGGDEVRNKIRRNIQYSQYLDPEFYNRVIFHVLHHINKE